MIYFCIPVHNEAHTVGLVLWKIRRVLSDASREYQLLVGDDASTDATAEVLDPYAQVLPLSVTRTETRVGYAATVQRLFEEALRRSDRHKRDVAVLFPADFAADPAELPEFFKRLDSGADLVVGEAAQDRQPDRWRRWVRRMAPRVLGRAVRVPGVHDVVSGVVAFRLITLRNAFANVDRRWLAADDWAANAQLIAWAAAAARRVETVPITERVDRQLRTSRHGPWARLRALWSARRLLPAPPAPAAAPHGGRPRKPAAA
jgi:glycosyltransferase involved in cell wall biosynthesis